MPSTRLTLVPALRLAAAALLVLGGCATLTVVPAERLAEQQLTPGAEPVAHIYAANWGLYLFKYLPLITPGRGAVARTSAMKCRSTASSESKQRDGKHTHRLVDSRPILLARLDADSVAQRVRGLRQPGETAMKRAGETAK